MDTHTNTASKRQSEVRSNEYRLLSQNSSRGFYNYFIKCKPQIQITSSCKNANNTQAIMMNASANANTDAKEYKIKTSTEQW
jgi:hypothetical protein